MRYKVWKGKDLVWKVHQFDYVLKQEYKVLLTYYDEDPDPNYRWECSCGAFKSMPRKFSDKQIDCRHIRVVKRVAVAAEVREMWNMADYDPPIQNLAMAEAMLADSELFLCPDCAKVLLCQGAAHRCGAYSKMEVEREATTSVYHVLTKAPKKVVIPTAIIARSESVLVTAKKRMVVVRPRRDDG